MAPATSPPFEPRSYERGDAYSSQYDPRTTYQDTMYSTGTTGSVPHYNSASTPSFTAPPPVAHYTTGPYTGSNYYAHTAHQDAPPYLGSGQGQAAQQQRYQPWYQQSNQYPNQASQNAHISRPEKQRRQNQAQNEQARPHSQAQTCSEPYERHPEVVYLVPRTKFETEQRISKKKIKPEGEKEIEQHRVKAFEEGEEPQEAEKGGLFAADQGQGRTPLSSASDAIIKGIVIEDGSLQTANADG